MPSRGEEARLSDVSYKTYKGFSALEKSFRLLQEVESGRLSRDRKAALYRLDFLLKQRLDQFTALFKTDRSALIADPQGQSFWGKYFGEQVRELIFLDQPWAHHAQVMVSWSKFFTKLQVHLQLSMEDIAREKALADYLDFTRDGFVSQYELGIFLTWFGPLYGCVHRLSEPLEGGYLCGFISAVEANFLLEGGPLRIIPCAGCLIVAGKPPGTFLVRFSKTQPTAFAVTFVESPQRVKHSLLYHAPPAGLTLRNPPEVHRNLREFVASHAAKLKFPVGVGAELPVGPDVRDLPSTAALPEPPGSEPGNHTSELAYKQKEVTEPQCVVCMEQPPETVACLRPTPCAVA